MSKQAFIMLGESDQDWIVFSGFFSLSSSIEKIAWGGAENDTRQWTGRDAESAVCVGTGAPLLGLLGECKKIQPTIWRAIKGFARARGCIFLFRTI